MHHLSGYSSPVPSNQPQIFHPQHTTLSSIFLSRLRSLSENSLILSPVATCQNNILAMSISAFVFPYFFLFSWLREKSNLPSELTCSSQGRKYASSLQCVVWRFEGCMDFPGGSNGKESACDAGDLGSIPELWRSQYSCVENPFGQRSLEGYSPWGHKELDTMSN